MSSTNLVQFSSCTPEDCPTP